MTLEELLAEAGSTITRLAPAEALAAVTNGALLVDIRSERSRGHHGVVPGALHVPRTVLEWRLEPGGRWRNPRVGSLERHVIVICDDGCSSVFAAAMLARLGYARASDVVGGFAAWRAAGLATALAGPPDPAALPGMGGPD